MSRAHALATLDARVARAHDTAPALLNAHVHMLRVYLAIIAQHNPPYYLHAAHLPVRISYTLNRYVCRDLCKYATIG